jgi:hypothetical protein
MIRSTSQEGKLLVRDGYHLGSIHCLTKSEPSLFDNLHRQEGRATCNPALPSGAHAPPNSGCASQTSVRRQLQNSGWVICVAGKGRGKAVSSSQR